MDNIKFAIQLCKDFNSDKFPLNAIIEPKIDGHRALAIVKQENDEVTVVFYSRNGKIIKHTDFLKKELRAYSTPNMVYDGEITVYGKTFENITSLLHKNELEENKKKQLRYDIFDCLTIHEWLNKKNKTRPHNKRREQLRESVLWNRCSMIRHVPSFQVHNETEAWNKVEDFIKTGFEGGVLKNNNSPYIFGRSYELMRMVKTQRSDLKVIGKYEGKGKHKNKLGGFLCDYNSQQIRVGSGLSDEQRKAWWDNDLMIGKLIEVEWREVTNKGKLRFPVFIRPRLDKEC